MINVICSMVLVNSLKTLKKALLSLERGLKGLYVGENVYRLISRSRSSSKRRLFSVSIT